jgi:hypothetical protein
MYVVKGRSLSFLPEPFFLNKKVLNIFKNLFSLSKVKKKLVNPPFRALSLLGVGTVFKGSLVILESPNSSHVD